MALSLSWSPFAQWTERKQEIFARARYARRCAFRSQALQSYTIHPIASSLLRDRRCNLDGVPSCRLSANASVLGASPPPLCVFCRSYLEWPPDVAGLLLLQQFPMLLLSDAPPHRRVSAAPGCSCRPRPQRRLARRASQNDLVKVTACRPVAAETDRNCKTDQPMRRCCVAGILRQHSRMNAASAMAENTVTKLSS